MYQKWDITFWPHLPRFLRHFFVFFSPFFRQPDRDYVRVLSRKSTADIVRFIRPSAAGLYPRWHIFGHPNVPKWHKIRWSVMPKRNRIDTFDDGLSSRSMTTTAAKGANNPQKMSQFGAGFTLFPDDIGVVFTHFPDVAPSQITHFPADERLRPPPPITLFQRFC